MPVRSWLDEGATVAAGTDTVRPFDPMLNIWGMVTRGTKDIGVQGADRESTSTRRSSSTRALALVSAAKRNAGARSSRAGSRTSSPTAPTR